MVGHPTVDERWNEMDHLAVLAAQPRSSTASPTGRSSRRVRGRHKRWASGEHDDDYDESFPRFRARVRDGVEALAEVGTAVVVTSGGPISAVSAALVETGTPTSRRLAPVMVNSSVTRVVSDRRGLTLLSFDDHALQAKTFTYR